MTRRPPTRRLVYRLLQIAFVILFLLAWTAVPETELIAAGLR